MTFTGALVRLGRLVVPVACPGCGLDDVRWCEECEAPWWDAPMRCDGTAPRLDGLEPPLPVWSIAALHGPVHDVIAAWKDRGRRDLAQLLAPAMTRAARGLAGVGEDGLGAVPLAVVPCPARAAHTRQRGADLPGLLAQAAAAGLSTPHRHVGVVRALLPSRGESRAAGDRGRWRARPVRVDARAMTVPAPRAVLLIDDVVTTGATLARAVQALAATPLVPVAALVLASAPSPETGPRVRP